MFLGFQYPTEIPGVSVLNFLRTAYNSVQTNGEKLGFMGFRELLKEKMQELDVDQEFMNRYLNDGFSGGEKKEGRNFTNGNFESKICGSRRN